MGHNPKGSVVNGLKHLVGNIFRVNGLGRGGETLGAEGFTLHATSGTANIFREAKIPVQPLFKIHEGRPNILDLIKNGEMHFIINTPSGQQPRKDEVAIRSAAVAARVATMTTLRGAKASVDAIRALKLSGYGVKTIQEFHA